MLRHTLFVFLSLAFMLATSPTLAATEASARPSRTQGAISLLSAAEPKGARIVRPKPGSEADESRYQAREDASPQASEYRGGHSIFISAGAIIIVLLVMILIILL